MLKLEIKNQDEFHMTGKVFLNQNFSSSLLIFGLKLFTKERNAETFREIQRCPSEASIYIFITNSITSSESLINFFILFYESVFFWYATAFFPPTTPLCLLSMCPLDSGASPCKSIVLLCTWVLPHTHFLTRNMCALHVFRTRVRIGFFECLGACTHSAWILLPLRDARIGEGTPPSIATAVSAFLSIAWPIRRRYILGI